MPAAGATPRVSVIIPVYNDAGTVARAIDSVLAQTFTDYEIICVDDGSTDESRGVLAGYGERIRVVEQSNLRTSAARNRGASLARGEYLAFLDADDSWLPAKLELSVAALDESPDCVMVYSDMATYDDAGRKAQSIVEAVTAHAPSMDEMLKRLWPVFPSAVVARRAAFEQVGGFCEELFAFEDVHLFLRLREVGPFRYLPQRLVRYSYPDVHKRTNKALNKNPGYHHFKRLVRKRYGRRAGGVLSHFSQRRLHVLSDVGLRALRDGDRRTARRCFRLAIGWNRYRTKSYMRLLRTFLPRSLAAALSSRTGRTRRRSHAR